MLCESCGERPARVHLTRTINGKKVERHLCDECARKEGGFEFMFELEPKFSIKQLLSAFLEGSTAKSPRIRSSRTVTRCDFCGLSSREFAREGKLGCDHCYETFADQLKPLFRKLHGHASHTGKAPGKLATPSSKDQRIQKLRQELEEAVAEERYERAAKLRDQLRELEQTDKLQGEEEEGRQGR